PISAILGRSCRHRSVVRSAELAVTRPPVGTCPAAVGLACVPRRTASMPLVKIVTPSVAQPVCNPPMGLGSASTRGACISGGGGARLEGGGGGRGFPWAAGRRYNPPFLQPTPTTLVDLPSCVTLSTFGESPTAPSLYNPVFGS